MNIDVSDDSVTFYEDPTEWIQSDTVESLGDWE